MAWTDKFASVAGAGAQDGTAGNDWTIAGALAAIGAGPAGTPTRVNVKAGVYASAAVQLIFNTAGAVASPVWWRGYKVAPGDQENNPLAVAGTDIPSFTFTTGCFSVTGPYQIFSNLDLTGASTLAALFNSAASGLICYGCRFRQQAGSTQRCVAFSGLNQLMARCYVSALSTQNAILMGTGTAAFLGNYVVGGNVGIAWTTGPGNSVIANVFDSIGGDAVQFTTGSGTVFGNAIYAPLGHGVQWIGTPAALGFVASNHFENVNQAGKAAINNGSGTASGAIRPVANSYFGCPTTVQGQGDLPNVFDLGTLSGSGFANAAGHDFSPSALLKNIGFPGQYELISTLRGWMTPGALQAAGGGRQPMLRIRGA